jgi:Skp family chaperone for outer membrane proteins
MKSTGLWAFLAAGALLATLLTGCDNGDKSKMGNTIRFVDTQQVLDMSGLSEQEAVHLKAVGEKLRDGLTLAQSRYATMDEATRRQAELSDRQVLEMQWRSEQQAAHQVVTDAMTKAVLSWQMKNKIDAVMPRQAALALAADVDITADIANALKNEQMTFGTLPEINLKEEAQEKEEAPAPAEKPAKKKK